MGKGAGSGGEANVSGMTKKITIEELAKHRTPDDAWITSRGKVYDVSNWYDHPGGSVIFTHAGDDFTDVFNAFHPPTAWKDMDKFYVGELDDTVVPEDPHLATRFRDEKQKQFEKAYRDLRSKLIAAGMFNASPLYYTFKVVSNLAIVATAAFCAIYFDSFAMHMIGAVLLGLFWQQCGWLAHDFLHHQVFKNRVYGDLMGIIIGDLFQGFSVQWWKTKHNSHHAVPNLIASSVDAADGDPDIDTLPILAWSLKMAEQAKNNPTARFLIRWQAVFYFPVLLFARLAWAQQSWVFVWGGAGQHSVKCASKDRLHMKFPMLERICLILHYAWILAIMYHMPLFNALAFFVVSQTSCGLMLALVFGLGHNGMAVYPAEQRPDFWKLQVTTTRNVTSNLFTDWFCGGLQYQVDHHLFPSLPRHNLGKVHKLVESFCKEHGVTYHEADMFVGTWEVLTHLGDVSKEFLEHFPAM
jgi:acyl-lipid Delta6-acetylenase / acyl-lipid (9-3)-desaturase